MVKTNRNFLSPTDRTDLVKIVRDGLEEHRIVRRANAILLLDNGWSYAEIAEALFLDDSTVRAWLKEFQEGGVEAVVLFDLKGGASRMSPLQLDELRAWATQVLPTSTTEIGQFILERFGLDYGRSGIIKLMNRHGNPAQVHRRARGFAQFARPGRGGRLRRRRPSDTLVQAVRTLDAARTALRAPHGVWTRPAEPAREGSTWRPDGPASWTFKPSMRRARSPCSRRWSAPIRR